MPDVDAPIGSEEYEAIEAFLQQNFVLALASAAASSATAGDAVAFQPWACSVYYAFATDAGGPVFAFLSDPATRHIQEFIAQPRAAAVIHAPPEDPANIADIRGVQMEGRVTRLEADGESLVRGLFAADPGGARDPRVLQELYYARFPAARNIPGGIFWQFEPDRIKMTDNARAFGFKRIWRRGASPA